MFKGGKAQTFLKKYIEMFEPHKLEAIYNKEYRYIKEIIWDDELNSTLGSTRKGYEKFDKGLVSYSGEVSLRTVTKEGNIVGYITETNLTSNVKSSMFREFYQMAKEETYRILDVKDKESFDYWLEDSGKGISFEGFNHYINGIKSLENVIEEYIEDEDFRRFLDKIKG